MPTAVPVIPKNKKDLAGFRSFMTQTRDQACSASEAYSGPMKKLFDDLVISINDWLGQLPKDDIPGDWSVETQMDFVFSLLAQALAASQVTALELNKLKTGDQFASLVSTEITRRVTAGELFTKDGLTAHVQAQVTAGELVDKALHGQLCSAARQTGLAEGENKVRAEITAKETQDQLIATRKTGLQEASLPLPPTASERLILGGTDAEFETAKTTYLARKKKLVDEEKYQLNSNELLANLWLSETEFKGFERIVTGLPQLKFAPTQPAVPMQQARGNASAVPPFPV